MKNLIMVFVLVLAAAACGNDAVDRDFQPFCSEYGCTQDQISCGYVGCVCDFEGGTINNACNPIPSCDELIEADRCEMVVADPILGMVCQTRDLIYVACHE